MQPDVTRASASQGACRPLRRSCPHSEAGAGLTETETTQAFQSGTNRVYRAAEQPSSHSPHHVSGSLAFTGFVGWKIWVYVCTYNIWQQEGIQIQLWRMLFAWVTVLAVDLFQRLLSEFLSKNGHFLDFQSCWVAILHAKIASNKLSIILSSVP